MFPSIARNLRLLSRRMVPGITRSYILGLQGERHTPETASPTPVGEVLAMIATGDSTGTPTVPLKPGLEEVEFWREFAPYQNASRDYFMSWRWNKKNIVDKNVRLFAVLNAAVPDEVPRAASIGGMQTRHEFCVDVWSGMEEATMSLRVTPYILSRINWTDPANCPIFRQFIPLKSLLIKNHPETNLDSLHERGDSTVDSIVHRYPDKALFLPISVCPTYCIHCTRVQEVGANTDVLSKKGFKPTRTRLQEGFDYMKSQKQLKDIVVSGGDSYYLTPDNLEWIGNELINMKNIERFRFATRGLAVAPNRFLDNEDPWAETLIRVVEKARRAGKHCAIHTQFNHPNEISWITEKASRKLFDANVTVRNQSVLLRGINDDVDTMSSLIQKLASMNIQPYYVYQCDMVPKVEHMRTPLQTILDLESQLRGTIAGFLTPQFVVDLPGGGGKRLACSYESYDRETGVSTFRAPALTKNGKEGKVYKYYDPLKPSS